MKYELEVYHQEILVFRESVMVERGAEGRDLSEPELPTKARHLGACVGSSEPPLMMLMNMRSS